MSRLIEEVWLDRAAKSAPRAAIGYDDISEQMGALLRGDSPTPF